MIILGIDPGTARLGFGIIETNKNKVKVVDYGCIVTTPDMCAGDRLNIINNQLSQLIKKHQPKILAIESLYFFKNLKTVMPVSQAKGVVLMTAAKKKIPVCEFTPLQVKMAVTGYGKAEKKQVQRIIETMLNLEEKPQDKNKRKDDAIDALGIAICYALNNKVKIS